MCRLDFWALWTTARAILDHCIPDSPPNLAIVITDVIADVAIAVIPIPLVRHQLFVYLEARSNLARSGLAFEPNACEKDRY